MNGGEPLTADELGAITEPADLLVRAWALEPPLRLVERYAALDRLQALLDAGGAPASPPGRDWPLELLAERAIDAAANVRLEEARALATRVLEEAQPQNRIAIARATLARGRELAWRGTEEATRTADQVLARAAQLFEELGNREWRAFTVFWRGNAVNHENGRLLPAEQLIRQALEIAGPDSPRRSTMLTFYADVLLDLGRREAATAALDEASQLADRHDDRKSRSYVTWGRARLAAAAGDSRTAERLLREVERGGGDWFEGNSGLYFLTDAALLLDRLGLTAEAERYLGHARDRCTDEDEAILQARAMLLARSGDPVLALDALQELVRGEWLEKRQVWRHTLLTAWATFRAGREDAGGLAAQGLEQAVACGAVEVAVHGEPDLVRAMSPPAERTGSPVARALLLDGRELLVRLFGTPTVSRADGEPLELPPGMPGELVRLLALHEHGLPVDVVLEAFFPDTAPSTGRHRLRQVLTRLRSAAGGIVRREGDGLRLAPAWVDVRHYLAAADRTRSARGSRAVRFAYEALAVHDGPLLPFDRYAGWADPTRHRVEYRQRKLLHLVAADALARGSHQEALTALESAAELDPDDHWIQARIADARSAIEPSAPAERPRLRTPDPRIAPRDPPAADRDSDRRLRAAGPRRSRPTASPR